MTISSSIKVLVAEDEELIRNHLIKKMESIDPALQVVCSAQDGQSAWNYVQTHQVDLLITDIRMPILDGIELVKMLHLHFPHIQKIIVTGYADFEYARHALRYDVGEYLLKPIKPNELANALAKAKTLIENKKDQYTKNLESLHTQSVKPEETVELVQHFLREHFTKNISLEEISRHFNFTPSYLSKIFIKYTGEPPSRYLITLRINEDKYLLTHYPHLSVKEVGKRVGYSDQFYFSRIFKQMTGVTPSEFLR
jgi:two-component system response regulator YesN